MNRLLRSLAATLLAMALILSSVGPAIGTEAYALTNNPASSGTPAVSIITVNPADVTIIKDPTTITGYTTEYNRLLSTSVTLKATVTPARGRKIQFQRYNSSKKRWTTIKTVTTKKTETATVKYKIPKEKRQKAKAIWRIYAPETDKEEPAASANINLFTRNVKTYKLSAKSACIYRIDGDGKGTLIYTKNSTKKRAQASTTKLMTAILLIESGLLDSTTKISRHAASTPYATGVLQSGDSFNTRDLLYAMLLPSANDAATAVAERVGGSESAFVAKMNKKAADLGLTKTHFQNPHGLDANGHYTTAVELAELTAYAYKFPEIRQCWATQYKTITSLTKHKRWTMWSTNAIFSYVKNFLGGKTGTENNAGCCFTGVYKYKGCTYVTVVLGSGYGFARWSDTKDLHNYIRKYAASAY